MALGRTPVPAYTPPRVGDPIPRTERRGQGGAGSVGSARPAGRMYRRSGGTGDVVAAVANGATRRDAAPGTGVLDGLSAFGGDPLPKGAHRSTSPTIRIVRTTMHGHATHTMGKPIAGADPRWGKAVSP